MIKYTTVFLLLCCYNMNAQFIKKFDLELSHGWMKNYNKGEIISGSGLGTEPDKIIITAENSLWTTARSISLGYKISKKHSVRLTYKKGVVGSRLDGIIESFSFADRILTNDPNIIKYKSYGLQYLFLFPIDGDYFLIEVGASRQKNEFEDTQVFSHGLFVSNYNILCTLGFGHSITYNFDLVSKITLINSISNNEEYSLRWESTFVPIQIGLELGFRVKV